MIRWQSGWTDEGEGCGLAQSAEMGKAAMNTACLFPPLQRRSGGEGWCGEQHGQSDTPETCVLWKAARSWLGTCPYRPSADGPGAPQNQGRRDLGDLKGHCLAP